MSTSTDLDSAVDPPPGDQDSSTAPAPVGPAPGGPRRLIAPVRRSWRGLTSMRTALLLLFLLALASVPGSLLPQRGRSPELVEQFFADHPDVAPLLDQLSLFDVFAAPWFAAVYLLLFISLIGCLTPRTRWYVRVLRAGPPPVPRTLSRLPRSRTFTVDGDPATTLAAARRSLRGWRIAERTTAEGDRALAAEKGYLREIGNLTFHIALVALLVGIALGGLFGYQGVVLVSEGRGFSNISTQYDTFSPTRLFSADRMRPFTLTLTDFHATYQPTGQPRTFAAEVAYTPRPDASSQHHTISVNEPLDVDGAKVYLLGHGYSPRLVVTDPTGQVAFDAAVPCLPTDLATLMSRCTVKVPNTSGAEYAFTGFFTPTTVASSDGLVSAFPAARKPGVTLLGYRGDLALGTGVPRSVYSLDTDGLETIGTGFLAPGDTWTLPDGATVHFAGYDEWATFQVTADPGKTVVLVAAGFLVAGLLLSLFVRRRRLWVRVRATDDAAGPGRTVVDIGGLGRGDGERFGEEFDGLTDRLHRACSGAPGEKTTTARRR